MGKTIFRETIIALLVSIAVLLILSVALYNYMPSNKVIPETVEYTPTKEIQEQLNAEVDEAQDTTEPYHLLQLQNHQQEVQLGKIHQVEQLQIQMKIIIKVEAVFGKMDLVNKVIFKF